MKKEILDKVVSVTGGLFVMSLILIITTSLMAFMGKDIPSEFLGIVSTVVAFWFGTQMPTEPVAEKKDELTSLISDLTDVVK